MKNQHKVNVGLIGFGTVGSGVVEVIRRRKDFFIEKIGAQIDLVKIADKDITSKRPGPGFRKILTTSAADVYDDPDIDVVIELVGGYEPARTMILKALRNGKSVVTANKALLAVHGKELFEEALKHNVSISYEASCGGGIPLIIALRDGLIANDISQISGILNGTANYILTQMSSHDQAYDAALAEAQSQGYAEADPTFDVEGVDAAHKLTILSSIAFGAYVDFRKIHIDGISRITTEDIAMARDLGCVIKLLAIGKINSDDQMELRVHPALIPYAHPLASIDGVENAVQIRGDVVGDVMLRGPGAGRMPTASAVTADLVDVVMGRARLSFHRLSLASSKIHYVKMKEIETRYCIRLRVDDRPGVFAKIAGVLAQQEVSIRSVVQKTSDRPGSTPIVILTHKTREGLILKSLQKISRMAFVKEKPVFFRFEEIE